MKIVDLIKRVPGVTIRNHSGPGHYVFIMHCNTAPFDNNDLRMALKLAIDREEMLDKILGGYGSIGNAFTYSQGGKQYVGIFSGVGGWAGIGLAAGLDKPTDGLGAVGGYALVVSSRESSVEGILRAATESGVAPEVAIAGTTGVVEARFLESADVLMLIGLNHADTPQRVTMTFPPDTQEAIWQNMETGAAVNFIAGADGPTYTHTFAPKDSLALMIRKSIR